MIEKLPANCKGDIASEKRPGRFRFRRGQMVVVRSLREILGTLDKDGKLEGLPFMPEMARYCGRTLRIQGRAPRVYHEYPDYVARLKRTVLLEGSRCNGAAHDGCQMRCMLLWKEAWLRPADSANGKADSAGSETLLAQFAAFPTSKEDGSLSCQATELERATTRLPAWDLRQYVGDVIYGDLTVRECAGLLWGMARNKILRLWRRPSAAQPSPARGHTPACSLGLQPGDLVEVRSKAEIEATLDGHGRNRGLAFTREMSRYCGGSFRVAGRVEKMVVEWTGQLRQLRDTVILEDVTCQGLYARRCPRSCYHLWREAWLKRVS